MTNRLEILESITVKHVGRPSLTVLLVRIFAHVDEGQDDERGFIGKRQRAGVLGAGGLVLEMGEDQ